MLVDGKMVTITAKELRLMLMVMGMQVDGKKANNTAKEQKFAKDIRYMVFGKMINLNSQRKTNRLQVQINLIPYVVSRLGTGVGLCPSTIQR